MTYLQRVALTPEAVVQVELRDAAIPESEGPPIAKQVISRPGQVPVAFRQRLKSAGSHLISLVVEPDPAVKDRPKHHVVKDHLPGDNQQSLAVEVLPAKLASPP